ncbi:serine hydrolase domain-containing protein [Amycolatopsis suaedae]|uniref:Class A beta-lactamase-related serine hydrolase n=1 Tax=Amycolatopsis suaedae TaxID=2510978 RepID=A0A4Q7JBD5_9PSEU|nr:serine hydrolase domain-containing protein [Amycolatopsis suaedae]RZQ64597.1 class A beta-lactamase-related serine hydrolase [Amycolatopsis suaedae]
MAIETGALARVAESAAAELGIVGAQVALAVGEDFAETPVGVENTATGRAVTANTLFQIGSTTKVFTAALLMRLAEAGEVDIDQPVVTYVPGFRLGDEAATKTVTPRHLMSMTSGIDNGPYLDTGRGDESVRDAVELVADLPVITQPGAGFGYSNASTNVSGLIIETITGTDWDTALRDRLLEPAGLRHSASLPEDHVYHPVAVGHVRADEGVSHARPWIFARGYGPAGSSLCCSAGDLVRFGRIFLRGGLAADGSRVLSERTVAAMQTPHVDVPTKLFADGWCLGPYTKVWDGVRIFGHSGTTPCGSSTLLWVPSHDAAVAVTVNVANRGYHFADRVFDHVFTDVLGITKPTRPAKTPGAPVDTAAYAGVYETADTCYRVTGEDGHLFVTVSATGPVGGSDGAVRSALYPLGDHRFLPADDAVGGHHLWDVAFDLGPDGTAVRFLNGAFAARRTR